MDYTRLVTINIPESAVVGVTKINLRIVQNGVDIYDHTYVNEDSSYEFAANFMFLYQFWFTFLDESDVQVGEKMYYFSTPKSVQVKEVTNRSPILEPLVKAVTECPTCGTIIAGAQLANTAIYFQGGLLKYMDGSAGIPTPSGPQVMVFDQFAALGGPTIALSDPGFGPRVREFDQYAAVGGPTIALRDPGH